MKIRKAWKDQKAIEWGAYDASKIASDSAALWLILFRVTSSTLNSKQNTPHPTLPLTRA